MKWFFVPPESVIQYHLVCQWPYSILMYEFNIRKTSFRKNEPKDTVFSLALLFKFDLTPQAQLSLQGTFFSFLIMLNSELCAWGVKILSFPFKSYAQIIHVQFDLIPNESLRNVCSTFANFFICFRQCW